MQPIAAIAARLGLTEELLEPYGRSTAKIRRETLERF
ncbi:MAG: formate--tetrahydrofolate ligase, partial [Acidobacteria bacterium]|nr:formate--tetrahydrofolate ligase [Acidobacteriota bacterium]